MGLQSVPTTPGADRQQGGAVERYPGAFFLNVGQPFHLPMNDPSLYMQYVEDFFTYTSGERGLASVVTDSGAVVVLTTALGGIIQLQTSDGTVGDNDEAYVGSENLNFILTASKKLFIEARVKPTEANTDDMNFIFGLSTTYAADTLQDNGAGPPANYSGAVFFKVDGGTVLNLETSKTTAQNTEALTNTFTTATWVRLGIYWDGVALHYYINGVEVGTAVSSATYLPAVAMGLVVGIKNGDTNEELLDVDYIRVIAER